ncbi:MAG: serine/threonine protein kinase [bacterium]|nr:serine/threonine protein kinase [bacterium]
MVTQLVAATTPGVRSVKANPGDWGIDTFVGELDRSGRASVWQSKFFIDGVDDSQKKQIREAFKSAVKAAKEHGYEFDTWILCIPCSMDGPATAWWDRWRKKQTRETGVPIVLWDETELRKRILSTEGDRVRLHFYGRSPGAAADEREVADVPDENDLDSTLFVRQLTEAGHTEMDSAKREFFNAELIAREVMDKAVPDELKALAAADAGVHAIWEHRFNSACVTTEGRQLPTLHADVMADIRSEKASLMPQLTANIVHVCGIAHRVVEDRRAGWVRDWRDVASIHLAEHDPPDEVQHGD